MAMDRGGYLRNSLDVKPGKLVMYPLPSALPSVDKAGEKRAALANVTNSAGVADPMAPLA